MCGTTGPTLSSVLLLTAGLGAVWSNASGAPTARPHSVQTRPAQTRPAAGRLSDTRSQAQSRPAATLPARTGLARLPEARQVNFPTKDNLLIAGTYTSAPKRVVSAPMAILVHMHGSDGRAFDPLVPALHMAGFAVLAIDLRGHGKSVGPSEMGLASRVDERDKKLFAAMDRDVEGAYTWMAHQPDVDPARFVLVGASVGCSIALKYAARDRSVDGVVCLTPGTAYLGIDSLSDARKYAQRPLLLLAGDQERAACDDLSRIVQNAVVQIIPSPIGADRMALHGTRLLGQVPHLEQMITQFLLKAAGPPSENTVFASVLGEVYHPSSGGGARQISPENIRLFSSPQEAEARGLRSPRVRTSRSRSRGTSADGESYTGDNPAFRDRR